jgi:hypothetical protein
VSALQDQFHDIVDVCFLVAKLSNKAQAEEIRLIADQQSQLSLESLRTFKFLNLNMNARTEQQVEIIPYSLTTQNYRQIYRDVGMMKHSRSDIGGP